MIPYEKAKFVEHYNEQRLILSDAIPLEMPLCISIEPSNICNFKCVMCHQGSEKSRPYGKPFMNMSMKCFEKIISDIKKWSFTTNQPTIKIIKLYSMGEPLINESICDMLRLIKEANICEEVEITTNASLLSEEIIKSFVRYELDILRISVYSIYDDNSKYITGSDIKPETIKAKVQALKSYRDSLGKNKPFISAKMIDTYTDENEAFVNYYKECSDEAWIDRPIKVDTGENILTRLYGEKADLVHKDTIQKQYYKEKKACRYPFTHLTIRSNGDVVICCVDWSRDTLIGNVNENSLEEIWNSKNMYDFRVMTLISKGLDNKVCKNCEISLRSCIEDEVDSVSIDRLSYKGII